MRTIKKNFINKSINSYFLKFCLILPFGIPLNINAEGISDILSTIQKLEGSKEPKCFATASRLENFMFGTPLTDAARFEKNSLQTQWVEDVWMNASKHALDEGSKLVEEKHIKLSTQSIFEYDKDREDNWVIGFKDKSRISINKTDERQYGSIAYSLRAILAVKQKQLSRSNWTSLPLSQTAIDELKQGLDLYTLSVLKLSDQKARLANQYELNKDMIVSTWTDLSGQKQPSLAQRKKVTSIASTQRKVNDLKLLHSIIKQKLASYRAYNEISNQLFIRNLQVYFARNRWPKDPEVGKQFKNLFTETLIAFAGDLYKGAESIALSKGHNFIKDSDVNQFVKRFIPHEINEYEDALFFPALDAKNRIEIESYDMDAFRDSGIHWVYLQHATQEPKFKAFLEPDPFASELIVENIAQFGVLALRMTGMIGKQRGDKRIEIDHFNLALKEIQKRITKNGVIVNQTPDKKSLSISSVDNSPDKNTTKKSESTFFTEHTSKSGIKLMHRSSDWLNRLLRSYLKKDQSTGIITIPPAFGGSGIAAEDINNDGLSDVLILSGLGNKLYINKGNGTFSDITESSGLDWKRKEDDLPGEPRQPIIADLDNDGYQDIVITYVDDTHRAYKNIGNGKFEDVTSLSKLGGKNLVGGPATVFDYDNDGLLDIYITYFGDYIHGVLPTLKRRNSNGLPNRLFKNMGNFKFKDVTQGSNLGNTGWAQAVAHTDLDNDGLQDLIVGNDFGINAYYKNLGDGTFKNITSDIGTDKPSYTMNIGLSDLNDDLLPDVYISNIVTMNKDEKYVLPNQSTEMKFNPEKLANMRVVEANDLFLSQVDDNKVSYQLSQVVDRGYSSTGWSWDADFFDFDNDGDDDLYVLNGMNEFNLYSNENPYYTDPTENKKMKVYIPSETKESNVFFMNEDGRFQNYSKQSGMNFLGNSRSAAYLDYDLDGDLDVVVNNYHGSAVAYSNNAQSNDNHWLKIKLQGNPDKSVNRDAIGSKIIVTTESGRRIWREIHSTIGYMSVHPKVQHFGLGKSTKANVEIIWPNGDKQKVSGISPNKIHLIKQNH